MTSRHIIINHYRSKINEKNKENLDRSMGDNTDPVSSSRVSMNNCYVVIDDNKKVSLWTFFQRDDQVMDAILDHSETWKVE